MELYSDVPTNFSRNAALAGAGAAAGAGGAYAATRPHDTIDESTHTDRSFPLSGGAIAPHSDNRPSSSVYSGEAPVPQSSLGNAGHIAGLNTGTAGGVGAESSDAALANLGLARHSVIDHGGHSHEFKGDPCETEPAEKTLPFVPGPHATVAANMLDPHVPGEFPREDGLDPHSSHIGSGFGHASEPSEPSGGHHFGRDAALVGGAGAAGLGAHEASKSHSSSIQQPASSSATGSDGHHLGRDAAIVGGTGAAGLGAHEALKSHNSPVQQPTSLSSIGSGVGYPAPLGSHEALADRTLPTQQPTYSPSNQGSPALGSGFPTSSPPEQSSNDHLLGRNAALAGGAGAAGLGAYAATRDRNEPTDLQQSSGSSALHPGTSDSTIFRPITQSQSPQHIAGNPLTGAREPEKEHHYGRDAALVGGAGASGYGVNQQLKDRDTKAPSTAGADGIVIEPTTGLPMNVGKYGHGTGGTDASPPIASHYNDPPIGSAISHDQQPLDQKKEHHYGRDAALVGGAGAAGYGAHEYSKDRGETDPTRVSQPHSSTANTVAQPGTTSHAATSSTTYPHDSSALNKADPRVQTQPLAQDSEHHYGRNAALAGGAGAAGVTGYSALQSDRGDTGPASKTIGPHKSNIANIVDPRVRPEPEKMKDHTTAGPWQSDTLNKLDPKVESDPNKADVKAHGYASGVATQPLQQQQQQQPLDQDKDHHYGRNAAVAGGAGAAAYGATQAYDKHDQEKLAKEQEKLAKEQEKQAQHDAKERAKEQEKQAKHDSKEADKQAKHDAHDAEKARKKDEEKHAKEQEKLDKHHAKEQEKAEEKRLKEQEKAEKERQKEQEKLLHEKEKEDAKLAAARSEEADAKHKHNKLHKEPPEEREKGGILHRIFHHKHYEREGAEGSRDGGSFEEGRSSGGSAERPAGAVGTTGQTVGGESSLGKSSFEQPGMGGEGDGLVTEPTTGLPMNVGKYGVGTGGTDGNEAIAGHYK